MTVDNSTINSQKFIDEKEFFQSASKGNLESLKQVVARTKNIKDIIDRSFIEAASNGHLEVVKYLLESKDLPRKANLHFQEDRAFAWSCNNKQWEVANYLLEQGSNITQDYYYAYRIMVINKVEDNNPLRLKLFNKLVNYLEKASKADFEYFANFALDHQDNLLKDYIASRQLSSFKTTGSKAVADELFITAIKYNDLESVKKYTNLLPISEAVLDYAIKEENLDVYCILSQSMTSINHRRAFLTALEHSLPIALHILKTHMEMFNNQNDMINYDPYREFEKENERFFIKESLLPRFYSPIKYNNNKEAFAGMILNQCLNCLYIKEPHLEILKFLLKNKTIFNIQDEHVVQYLVENNYDLGIDDDYDNQFEEIVTILYENKVSFKSDTQGYLIQIARLNRIYGIVNTLMANGSNMAKFVERVKDKNNWLTDSQYEDQLENDCNGDSSYDIYKKFDKYNSIEVSNELDKFIDLYLSMFGIKK